MSPKRQQSRVGRFSAGTILLALALALVTVPYPAAHGTSPSGVWEPIGPRGADARRLASGPLSGRETLYLLSRLEDLFASGDGGATWEYRGRIPSVHGVGEVMPHPAVSDLLYSADRFGTQTYRSTDGGLTWEARQAEPDDARLVDFSAVVFHPFTVLFRILDGGDGAPDRLERSHDEGESWETVGDGLPAELVTVVHVAGPPGGPSIGRLVVATGAGLQVSDDRGRTFVPAAGAVAVRPMTALAAVPDSPRVYALDGAGDVYVSEDRGGTWRATGGRATLPVANLDDLPAVRRNVPDRLRVDRRDDRTLYAVRAGYLLASGDGGASWRVTEPRPGIPARDALVRDVLPWAGEGEVVAAVAARYPAFEPAPGTALGAAERRGGTYLSADAGRTWRPGLVGLQGLPLTGLAVRRGEPATLYAAWDRALLRSTAGGGAGGWQPWPLPAVPGFPDPPPVVGAWVHPRQRQRLVVRAFHLRGSHDGGATWRVIPTGCVGADRVAFAPGDPDLLYLTGNSYRTSGCGLIGECAFFRWEEAREELTCIRRDPGPQGPPLRLTHGHRRDLHGVDPLCRVPDRRFLVLRPGQRRAAGEGDRRRRRQPASLGLLRRPHQRPLPSHRHRHGDRPPQHLRQPLPQLRQPGDTEAFAAE